MLSNGMVSSNGILLSEQTLANALAVFPAEATTMTPFELFGLAQTE